MFRIKRSQTEGFAENGERRNGGQEEVLAKNRRVTANEASAGRGGAGGGAGAKERLVKRCGIGSATWNFSRSHRGRRKRICGEGFAKEGNNGT